MSEDHRTATSHNPGPLRIAYLTRAFTGEPVHSACRDAVEKTAATLADLGHHVEEFTRSVEIQPMLQAWTHIVACGTALSVHAVSNDPLVYESQIDGVTRGAVRLAEQASGADYLQAVETIHAFGRQMARHLLDIDVLLTPTLAEPPARVGRFKPVNEDFMDYRTGPDGVFAYSPFTAAFNASGQPAVSLPLHWTDDDLPVGVHLAASFGDDALLMCLAAQLEVAVPWREKQASLFRKLWA